MKHRSSVFFQLAVVAQLLWSFQTFGKPRYYDEIFDENGKIRPHYAEVYATYMRMTPDQIEEFRRKTIRDFLGDNALAPLPRLLLESEYEELRGGTEQRALALVRFLQDHYSGKKSYLKAGIIPEDALQRILLRAQEFGYDGMVDPEAIAFNYGPDIIRDADGVWRVVEDNPGYIGGPGDLIRGREIILRRNPELQKQIDIRDNPWRFFTRLVNHYRSRMKPKDGKIVMLTLRSTEVADQEDVRLKAIMSSYGVDVVTASSIKQKLKVEADGVYLYGPEGQRDPVGYLILNGEHADLDIGDPVTRRRALIADIQNHLESYQVMLLTQLPTGADAEDRRIWRYGQTHPRASLNRAKAALNALLVELQTNPSADPDDVALEVENVSHFAFDFKSGFRKQLSGLVEAIASGKLRSNYSPGVDFIGDKEFYLYLEDLVKFYLKQEPILKNIPTIRLYTRSSDGTTVFNETAWRKVKQNLAAYVIKGVDGRGGDAVWIGGKMNARGLAKLEEVIRANPARFVAQAFTHLSVLGGGIVDVRMITSVDTSKIIVSETPWGRWLSLSGNGKVNVSDQGAESAVIVVRDPVANCGHLEIDGRRAAL